MSATARKMPKPGPAAYTPEWHQLRVFNPEISAGPKVTIGASEAAAACNESPYSSALQLYLEKRDEMPQPEHNAETLERLEMGLEMEPIIINRYQKRLGIHVRRPNQLYFHPGLDWMVATPDGLGAREENLAWEDHWSIDAKNTGQFRFDPTGQDENKYGREGTDEIPIENLFQAQHQLAVLGLEQVAFPVLFQGCRLRIYTVQRNDELIASMIDAERELVERIINGDPPAPNWTHSGTKRCLESLHGFAIGSVATLSPSSLALWRRREEITDEIAAREKERDALGLQLLHEIGDCEKAVFEGQDVAIKRIVIKDSIVTPQDVEELSRKIGGIKRKGYQYLKAVKR